MTAAAGHIAEPRPTLRAALWLGLLGVTFFVSYLGSLEIVSWRDDVPVLVFAWERQIPFLAWTIVPYWSIDLFYAAAFFLCATRAELAGLVRRLLTAQAVAVAIFLIAPLKLAWTAPAETGVFAPLFALLDGVVGKPYNLAPSLHIALLVILWAHYARHVPVRWHPAMHLWAGLIGVSVLTAYQHHFFDVPTGAALGLFCLWLWPADGPSPLAEIRIARDGKRWRVASAYLAGSLACVAVAVATGGVALWLLWPALSLALVAAAYAALGPAAFQKRADGRMSRAARWLLWPYLIGARGNACLWTARRPAPVEIAPDLWLGPLAAARQADRVLDLCAELPTPPGGGAVRALPLLDLVAALPEALAEAALALDDELRRARRTGGSVLVCCVLGRSRSAAVAALWLAAWGGAGSTAQAIATLRRLRPEIALGPKLRAALRRAAAGLARHREFCISPAQNGARTGGHGRQRHQGGHPGRRPRHPHLRGKPSPPEADDRDRRPADPVARDEDICRPRPD